MARKVPYFMKRGSWRPARLTTGDQRFLIWCILVFAVIRALDYITGADKPKVIMSPDGKEPTTSLSVLENALPLSIWGGVILLGVAVLATGTAMYIHFAVWLGHAILGVVGTVLTLSTLITALSNADFDGIRSFGSIAVVTLLHWIFWARTGPRPLQSSDAVVVEQTGEPK